jgi:pyruvate dehydrogenase E2 component (dihydrolipoamide acetyltransferase)
VDIFKLPDLGEGLPDAEIVRWFVKIGDLVEADQILAEMETAKAVVEVPAPQSGRIVKLHGEPGDVIETGKPLVTFGNAEEFKKIQAVATEESAVIEKPAVFQNTGIVASAPVKALARKMKVDLQSVHGSGKDGMITLADVREKARQLRTDSHQNGKDGALSSQETNTVAVNFAGSVRAAPRVRAYASEHGVDIRELKPTGHKDNITLKDVKSRWTSSVQSRINTSGDYRLPERTQEVTGQPQKIRGERRAMALAMAKTRDTTVNTTIYDKAYIDNWLPGSDISVRLVRATIAASMVEPSLNAWFDGENMERTMNPHVDIGIAVDSPHGLSVPVIRAAETLSPAELRAEINRLRQAVYGKTIKPEELKHPSITLSNFGMIAGLFATPIVIPPQIAIVATGRIDDELRLTNGGIIKSRYVPVSLSFDHRGATGGDAARFLAAYVADLTMPY